MLSILLHWSSIREMRGDTATIALPPATDLPDIRYSKQTEESGSILTPPSRCEVVTRKHPIFQSQVTVLAQFRSALPPEGIGEHDRELLQRTPLAYHSCIYSYSQLTVRITLSALTSRVYKHNRTSTVPVEFHRSLAHAQTVETRPFSPRRLGPGNEAKRLTT